MVFRMARMTRFEEGGGEAVLLRGEHVDDLPASDQKGFELLGLRVR